MQRLFHTDHISRSAICTKVLSLITESAGKPDKELGATL